jgi:hypothetical protein
MSSSEKVVNNMNTRISGLMLMIVLSISSMLAVTQIGAPAPSWPNLPSSTVQLNVIYWGHSYFKSTLSGVPAGYDVTNGVYKGWCVDRSTTMQRSVSHDVVLYSSLTPPAPVSGLNWVAINYIINHKQGTQSDVQKAIWHFTNDYTPLSTLAQAMVNEADNNPNYDITTAPILAVVCLPSDHTRVQITIIELCRSHLPGLSPGYWKHNVKIYNGGPGGYSAPYEGMPHETNAKMLGYAATILSSPKTEIPASVVTADDFLKWVNTEFQNPSKNNMWLTYANWFNQAAGYLPYTGS